MIKRITLTGADDSTDLKFMRETSEKYPLIEWGILVSKKALEVVDFVPPNIGTPRFPSKAWLNRAHDELPQTMNLSCHLCGKWVRDLCFEGDTDFVSEIPMMFRRIQLNFHAIVHMVDEKKFISALQQFAGVQFIFQLDDVNNHILDIAKEAGIDAAPLFDTSGGVGRLPESWPSSVGYAGYAGGLSPENLAEQMVLINQASENKPIWIDAETHLRSNNDQLFDEKKILAFIEQAYNFI